SDLSKRQKPSLRRPYPAASVSSCDQDSEPPKAHAIGQLPRSEILLPAVGSHFRGRDGLIVAIGGHQVFQERVAVGVFGAPSRHLVEFLVPSGAAQTVGMNDAQAVTGQACALLLLLPLGDGGLVGGPGREGERQPQEYGAHHTFSTVTPTRSMPFHR